MNAGLVDDALVLLLLDWVLVWKHLVIQLANTQIKFVSFFLVMPLDALSLLLDHIRRCLVLRVVSLNLLPSVELFALLSLIFLFPFCAEIQHRNSFLQEVLFYLFIQRTVSCKAG